MTRRLREWLDRTWVLLQGRGPYLDSTPSRLRGNRMSRRPRGAYRTRTFRTPLATIAALPRAVVVTVQVPLVNLMVHR